MFSLKRKGDYRVQLTRTLKKPGRYRIELYLFTPHESNFSAWTMTEQQFYFSALLHRFGLLGLPAQERASKEDSTFALLSPHYEITYGSWLFRYTASMDRLRQQLQSSGAAASEPIARALRLTETYASRLRRTVPEQTGQQRYFRQMDIYFSWYAEQFLLECMTLAGYEELDADLRESIEEFLLEEYRIRKEREYLADFHGKPTRVWNRMSLYHRLLEYPVLLRSKRTELGEGTRKLVKAATTTLIMGLFTYILFNARTGSQLSITLLLGIAMIYGIRDLLRDDLITMVTRWLRKGRPRWKNRLLMPYTNQLMAQQAVWLDYCKVNDLPRDILENAGKWATEERHIVCYRTQLNMTRDALEQNEIQERLNLDCEPLCELIEPTRNRLFASADAEEPFASIEAHPIEKQHDYNLLLIFNEPGARHTSAQRWRLRLGASGIVECESKKINWPEPEQQTLRPWYRQLRRR
ncbi:hypothetical protein [Halopseudomonas pertucinogena]|uniref:SMODS-associated and fused to various effectors domain-containing protein n=1 Tax=Halopseudomonas pertucinogena TaxID=86175 RepID=A0ABQ2CTT3_9GAMM|nr:hypothetical protein [Halopseudomonas pertucinogena]GGJ05408.1 hypothetical protein GCM10009083_22830 [Halopseudomonas pertucinogena]